MAKSLDSLGVQKQLNALFEQRLRLEEQVLETMQKELQIAISMQAVLGKLNGEEAQKSIDDFAEHFAKAADEAENTGSVGQKALTSIQKGAEEAGSKVSIVGAAFTGMTKTLKSIVGAAAGVAGSMLRIGKAVLSIPLSIFKNLLNDAASFSGDTSFMEALENIRKEFGSFKEDVSKNILGAYKEVNQDLQKMTGLSVWKVFGRPAEQLKYLHDVASKAGSQMHQFGEEFSNSAAAIAAFDKGMGIGSENLRAFMNRATILGTDLQAQLKDTANYALQMGKAFGMSSKTLSRDVGMMMKDVKNFGSLTQKEMTVAAVYTRKLGLEVKDLTGLVGQFDNFDKAAESAALLSQAFGASVDAFKLMNEQDPAKRLDDLRKSLQATGKSTENMTRQELKLLAQTSGLSEEAAQLAFSNKNQGLSYDEVQKKANKAQDAQLTQAEALKKLADNIERVVMAGGQLHGSFFKMFFAGMERGIKWSKEYRGAMITVRQALWATHQAGMEVGRQFAASENIGFGKFMKNFGATFSPQNVNKLMHGFKSSTGQQMRGVVAELNDVISGKQGFGTAVENIRKTFNTLVKDNKTFGEMLDGGKKMMMFFAKGIGSSARFVVKELINILKFLTNPKKAMEEAKQAGGAGASFGMELVNTVKESFGDPKVLKELKTAGVAFIKALAKKVKEVLKDPEVQKLMMEIGGPFIGAMLGRQALSMAPSIISKFGPMLARAVTAGGAGGALAAGAGIALAGAALVNVNKKLDQFENSIDKRRDPASRKIGAYGSSLLQGLTLGLIPDNIAVMMAGKIAELADAIFEGIKGQMGAPFTNKLKKYFSAHIDFLSSVGGLIGAIFSGDNAKISEAAEKMGDNLYKLVLAAFDFLITEFPKILIKLPAILDQVAGAILVGLGNALDKIGDKLGPFGIGFKAMGFIFKEVGVLLKELGKAFEWISDKLKDFDLTASLENMFNKMKLIFADAGITLLQNIPSVIAVPLGLGNAEQRGKAIAGMLAWKQGVQQNMEEAAAAAAKAAEESAKKQAEIAKQAADAAKGQEGAAAAPGQSAAAPAEAQSKALEDFNAKVRGPAQQAMEITAGVTKSINELNEVLGDGSKGAMQIGAKLKRFADSSGLGKNGTYEIKNKGINLKLDLKITMDAGEVEKTILLRKDSILFDSISDITTLSGEHAQKINELKALKGGK